MAMTASLPFTPEHLSSPSKHTHTSIHTFQRLSSSHTPSPLNSPPLLVCRRAYELGACDGAADGVALGACEGAALGACDGIRRRASEGGVLRCLSHAGGGRDATVQHAA